MITMPLRIYVNATKQVQYICPAIGVSRFFNGGGGLNIIVNKIILCLSNLIYVQHVIKRPILSKIGILDIS